MLKLNDNIKFVNAIVVGTEKKGGYCPCLIFKEEESKCPFYKIELPEIIAEESVCIYSQENLDVKNEGCHCKLYIPVE